ncbi:MAG: Hsp70 family protein, partial [Burkholderiaceae bacterium]
AEDDKKVVELVTARNQADALVHSVKKSMSEYGDKLDAADKGSIEAAIRSAEDAIKSDDKENIESASEALMTASQKLGEKMAADAQAAQAAAGDAAQNAAQNAGGQQQGKPADDNVVDAEFKEVKRG